MTKRKNPQFNSGFTEASRAKSNANLKPFVKGDPRINRDGRPKDPLKLRNLAQRLAHEIAKVNGVPIEIDGHLVTQVEMILRQMIHDDPVRFLKIAFGEMPDQVDVRQKSEVIFRIVRDDSAG